MERRLQGMNDMGERATQAYRCVVHRLNEVLRLNDTYLGTQFAIVWYPIAAKPVDPRLSPKEPQ